MERVYEHVWLNEPLSTVVSPKITHCFQRFCEVEAHEPKRVSIH